MIKKYFAYFTGMAYLLAGINHFWHPEFYTHIMPSYIPYALAMVYISGVAEILGGVGFFIPGTRKAAAWGIVALLIAISPVHINMALHTEQFPEISPLLIYLRIPLQLILIWLAYIYTKD